MAGKRARAVMAGLTRHREKAKAWTPLDSRDTLRDE
jgi:hypothetical protein